jgi:D-ribose pyranase
MAGIDMKETGLLNMDISDALAHLGHMDELIICDAGFPIPAGMRTIDVSIKANQPTTYDVVAEILQHFSVEKIVLAEETQKHSPTSFARLNALFSKDVAVETMPHTDFKQRSRGVKAVIRTGDFTAYSNILLVSGAGPRWFVEQD